MRSCARRAEVVLLLSWSRRVYEVGECNWQKGAIVVGQIWSSISRQVKWSMVTVQVKARGLVVDDVRVIKVRVRPITGLLGGSLLPKDGALEGHLWGHCHRLVHCWTRWCP
jgi:hypothetical protein